MGVFLQALETSFENPFPSLFLLVVSPTVLSSVFSGTILPVGRRKVALRCKGCQEIDGMVLM
jgi:hypothetical protein